MAIPFLNNITLNNNEIQNVKLHNTGASNAAAGQIFFNTGVNLAQYYANAIDQWVSLKEYSFGNGTYINANVTGTAAKPIITPDLSAVDGTSTAASMFLTKDNEWATIPFGDITAVLQGTYINIDNSTGPEPTVNHDLTTRTDTTSTLSPGYGVSFTAVDSVTTNSTGHITALNVKTVTMPAAETYTFNVTGDSGTDQTIDSGNTLDIAGGTNISTVVGATDTVTVNLNDSISLLGSLTVNTTGDFTGQVTIPQVPVSDTDAASKHYVDQAVTGALSYQGAYNAATNTPDLDSSPSSTIKTGWTYTVTVEGLFFTEQVRVGDVLIANNNAPTTLAEWTTVQNNIDLASATTVGIGNVNANTDDEMLGIDVIYASGTAKVGLAIEALTAVTTTADASLIPIFDDDDAANRKISVGDIFAAGNAKTSKAYTITDSAVITYPFTLTAATINDTIIQLVDTVTNDTVYADINRTSVTTATITFSTTPTNSVRVLVQKIG